MCASLARLRGGADQQHTSIQRHQQTCGNQRPSCYRTTASKLLSLSSPHSTSSALHLSAVDASADARTQALQQAMGALNDDHQTPRDFGGIPYWNTAADRRFRVLFVLGGPGAGKGTQSALMEENYPVAHFSVGELLRQVPPDSPHKAVIEQTLVAGQIVPVEISLALLREAMEAERARVGRQSLCLVDGFPRNFDNLDGWCRVMAGGGVAVLETVLVYQCPLHILQERILERAQSSGRTDDNIESVRKRFATFQEQTVPVVETLRQAAQAQQDQHQRWSVVDIAGDRSLEDVWCSTQQVLNQLIVDDVLTANAALLDAVRDQNVEVYGALCDDDIASANSPQNAAHAMQQLEQGVLGQPVEIRLAQVDVISGRQVAVSYNRKLEEGTWVREKRFWSHQGCSGWRHVHFQRTPAPMQ